ncbi:hypothetical protein PS2_032731 [Malus domestica]|uniref:Uncharacterized protein n=1 Tax=Malus domestica TaxID=3750 RepID=A0A498K014_MALDO|nr:hypothetical protein DVH24_014839 [Malus domestica]
MLYLAMEVVLVLENGIVVSVQADSIEEHLLLVVEEGVGAKVVGEVDALVHRGAASVAIAGAALVPAKAAVSVAPHVASVGNGGGGLVVINQMLSHSGKRK